MSNGQKRFVWQTVTAVIGGLIGGAFIVMGALYGQIQNHEKRIVHLEEDTKLVACWVRAQINDENPEVCLFESDKE